MTRKYAVVLGVLTCFGASPPAAALDSLPRIDTVYGVGHTDLTGVSSFYLVSYGTDTGTITPGDGAAGAFVADNTLTCSVLTNNGIVLSDSLGNCFQRQNVNGDTRQLGLFRHSKYDHADNIAAPDATPRIAAAFNAAALAGLAEVHTSGISLNVAPGSGVAANLSIKQGMSLSCDAPATGDRELGADFRNFAGTLWTGLGGMIVTGGNNTSFQNCVVMPQWYAAHALSGGASFDLPVNDYADFDAIREDMILAHDTGYACTDEFTDLHDVLILGYDNPVSLSKCANLSLKNVRVDGNVGFYANLGGGLANLSYTDVGPILTRDTNKDHPENEIPNEEYWTITNVIASAPGECHLTLAKTSWDTTDLKNSTLDSHGSPIGYPVWVANLKTTNGNGHSCNGRWAVHNVTPSGTTTATLDLVGSSNTSISATGQWNANSNLIYIRSGFTNIAVGQTVTISSTIYTVVGILPRTKGPDPNDSFIGGVLVTPIILSSSPSVNLDDPASDVALTFANPTPDLSSTCDGHKIGGCLFLNAAERAFSGNSTAGQATRAIPSSKGSQLAAGYFFDGTPGARLVNSFSFAHQYGYILKDSNSATFSIESGDENGELDDPNELFFGIFGDSNQASILGNKNGQSGSSFAADTYLATDDDHTGLHQSAGTIGSGTGATVTVSSTSGWPKAGTMDICSQVDMNGDCRIGQPHELTTYEVTSSTQFTLIARGQWGTAEPATAFSSSTLFRAQISSWPGCVSFDAVTNPSTTNYLNDVEALHGCLLLTNVRTKGNGIGFVSRNVAPSRFVGTIMDQVALYFEDATARSLLDTTTSLFLSGGQPAPGVTLLPPQGRLSCDSTAPVQTVDQNNCTTIYYLPYTGWIVPVNDGRGNFSFYSIGSGLSLPLDNNSGHTGYQQSGKLYDLFVGFDAAGVIRLGTGPAWTSDTARANGIVQVNGVWVNAAAMSLRYSAASGGTVSCPAFACTYAGTMRATGDGQTKVQLGPTSANGGANNFVGLWNAYNRVKAFSVSIDATNNWGCTTSCGTWQPLDQQGSGAGLKNRVSVVDGLAQSAFDILLMQANANLSSSLPMIGTCIDSTNCTPSNPAQIAATTRGSVGFNTSAYPKMGFHYVQAVQQAANSTATNEFGTAATLRVDWEY